MKRLSSRLPVVLVVDDTISNLDLLVDALAPCCELRVATDGAAALALAADVRPDLVLLDVLMPGLDGFQVMERLRRNPDVADVPVIFLTSLTDEASERRCLQSGAVDFITKPFTPSRILARVNVHLELKAHRDHLAELVLERTYELERTREATIASMAILAEFRDNETGAHVQRTRHYVRALLHALPHDAFPPDLPDFELVSESAALHDIGKVAIPDEILFKPGRLTPDEMQQMKRHPLLGAEVLRRTEAILGTNSFLRVAREIAECHHERWDGTGYPRGLKGTEIPLPARIMAVADAYDALTSRRPYKPAFTHAQALTSLLQGDDRTSPGHFCPTVLAAFVEVADQFESIALRFRDEVR
jgi:putative two-component system response regulator